jgi:hypothetical protein
MYHANRSSKYRNIKKTVDGKQFDSAKEADRYNYLKLLQLAGEIQSFEHHKKYVLLESFTNARGVHRSPITYTPDFVITRKDGSLYAEDIKGSKNIITDLFSVKQKLFEKRYPDIEIKLFTYKDKRWFEITRKKPKKERGCKL